MEATRLQDIDTMAMEEEIATLIGMEIEDEETRFDVETDPMELGNGLLCVACAIGYYSFGGWYNWETGIFETTYQYFGAEAWAEIYDEDGNDLGDLPLDTDYIGRIVKAS